MSPFQWIESIGTIVSIIIGIGLLAWFRALNAIVSAQMHTNGGGTMLDKVNQIPDLATHMLAIGRAVERVEAQQATNHAEGQSAIAGLSREDEELKQQIDELTVRANAIDKTARDFGDKLAPRLELQDAMAKDVSVVKADVAVLKEDVARLKQKVFGDE